MLVFRALGARSRNNAIPNGPQVMIFELVEDITAALAVMPADHPKRRMLELLAEAVRRDVHFIARHSTAFFQCLWNLCWWYDCPKAAAHYVEPEGGWPAGQGAPPWARPGPKLHEWLSQWRRAKEERTPGFRWLRMKRPPRVHVGSAQRAILSGHNGGVNAAAWSPQGDWIVTGSGDYTARLWEASTGRELCRLYGHKGGVASVAICPEGRRIVTGGAGPIRVWDARTRAELRCLGQGEPGVKSVAISPDGRQVAASYGRGGLRLWDAETGQELHRLGGTDNWVDSVVYAPDGRRIVSRDSAAIRIWDTQTWQELRCFSLMDGGASAPVACSPDGRHVAARHVGDLCVLDSDTGQEIFRLCGHEGRISSVAYSPDGRRIATGCEDGAIRLWCAETGRLVRCLRGHEGPVGSMAYSPDGTWLVSGSSDETARLWDAECDASFRRICDHADRVQSLAFSPDGRSIATASGDQTVRLWEAASGMAAGCLRGHEGEVVSVTFSPDARHVASCSKDATVRVWDVASGSQRRRLYAGADLIRCPACRARIVHAAQAQAEIPTLRTVGVASWSGHAREVPRTARLCCLRGGEQVAYWPDGGYILAGLEDKAVRLWDAESGDLLRCFHGHDRAVLSVCCGADGRRIVSGSADDTARLWDVESGREVASLGDHENGAVSVRFLPGSGQIVTWSDGLDLEPHDNAVRVWDPDCGEAPARLTRPDEIAESPAAVLLDPLRVVSLGQELAIVDEASGGPIAYLAGRVDYIAADPAGRAWAGTRGSHLFLVRLEGAPLPDERVDPAVHRPGEALPALQPKFADEDAAARAEPIQAAGQYALAAALQNQEAFGLAATEWARFLRDFGTDDLLDQALYNQGVCYVKTGRSAEAIDLFRTVLTDHPSFTRAEEAHFALGVAQSGEAGKGTSELYAPAAETFRTFLREYPDSPRTPDAMFTLAECLYQQGLKAEAGATYEKLLSSFPQCDRAPEALYGLGVCWDELDRSQEARAAYDRFLKEHASHEWAPEVAVRLGDLLVRAKAYAQAAKHFAAAASAEGSSWAMPAALRHARCVFSQGRYGEAAGLYSSAAERFPQSPHAAEAVLNAGRCYYRSGDFAQAREWFGQLLEAAADLAEEAAHWIARSLIKEGAPAAAIPVVEKALSAQGGGAFAARLRMDQAEACYAIPDRRAASIALYAALAAEYPQDPVAPGALYAAAYAAFELADYDTALHHADAFLPAYPANDLRPDVMHIAAECNLQLRRLGAAATLYESLLHEAPDRPEADEWRTRLAWAIRARKRD